MAFYFSVSAQVYCEKDELDELNEHFRTQIVDLKNVREPECQQAIQISRDQGKILHRRSWETIKKKVNYLIVQNRKKNKNNR